MSDLAEEKKRAEVEADESWWVFVETINEYLAGTENRATLESEFLAMQQARDIERGLRHELEND